MKETRLHILLCLRHLQCEEGEENLESILQISLYVTLLSPLIK